MDLIGNHGTDSTTADNGIFNRNRRGNQRKIQVGCRSGRKHADALVHGKRFTLHQRRGALCHLDTITINAQCSNLLQLDMTAFDRPDRTLADRCKLGFDHIKLGVFHLQNIFAHSSPLLNRFQQSEVVRYFIMFLRQFIKTGLVFFYHILRRIGQKVLVHELLVQKAYRLIDLCFFLQQTGDFRIEIKQPFNRM